MSYLCFIGLCLIGFSTYQRIRRQVQLLNEIHNVVKLQLFILTYIVYILVGQEWYKTFLLSHSQVILLWYKLMFRSLQVFLKGSSTSETCH